MEWKDAVKKILSRRRQSLGDPVSLDEVLAFHSAIEGEAGLSPPEKDGLLDRIAADPRAARQLLSLLRFPESMDSESDDDNDEANGASTEQRWTTFRKRLEANGEFIDPLGEPSISQLAASAQSRIPSRRHFPALAASFLLGVLLTSLHELVPQPSSRGEGLWINLPIIELLAPAHGGTRTAERVQVPASAEGLVITLAAPGLEAAGTFELILERGDEPVLEASGLHPGPGGVFVVTVSRQSLGAGRHRLRLVRESGGTQETMATFFLEVALAR